MQVFIQNFLVRGYSTIFAKNAGIDVQDGGLGHSQWNERMSCTLLLPEVVPDIDVNPISFYGRLYRGSVM